MNSETGPEDTIRDLAYALFSLGVDGEGAADARHERWSAERATHITNARRLIRRLESKGYAIHKTG